MTHYLEFALDNSPSSDKRKSDRKAKTVINLYVFIWVAALLATTFRIVCMCKEDFQLNIKPEEKHCQ